VPQIVTAAAITDTAIDAAPSTNFTITTSASATVAFSFPTVSGGAVYGTDYTALFPTTSNITVAPVTGQLGSFVATFTAAGTQPINIIGMADQSAVYPLVIELTVASGTSYQLQATTGASVLDTTVTPNVLDATVNLQQSTAVLVGENKPTPGQYNTGSSGGCGNGSGFATLLGLLLAAVSLTIVRRRQP
jgi:hypothetical protein